MKILICNKYFFLNGGTERYLHDLIPGLASMGHTPIPFSVNYAGSWESPYSDFFLPSPGPPDQIYYKNVRLSATNVLRYLDRSVYSIEARIRLSRLLRATGGADVAYLLNIYNFMSPSIIHTLHNRGIPVILRLGDYNLLCPAYLFLREGKPCTLCLQGSYFPGLKYCCVKNSMPASALRVLSMYVHKWTGIYNLVDAFVVPCHFMRQTLMQGGFPAERIQVLRSPVAPHVQAYTGQKRRHILYFGRISREKGLDTLIQAYQQLPAAPDLLIAGRSYDGEQERLENLILPAHRGRIHFTGFKNTGELSELIAGALVTVAPSRWYDNAPLSINESFIHETPVIGASIGGIPEQIQDGITGKLFVPDSDSSLRETLIWMLADHNRLRQMGKAGRTFVEQECAVEKHTGLLLDLFERLRGHAKN
jgi:glycosyltransferase involved in cell wall biosynthesis